MSRDASFDTSGQKTANHPTTSLALTCRAQTRPIVLASSDRSGIARVSAGSPDRDVPDFTIPSGSGDVYRTTLGLFEHVCLEGWLIYTLRWPESSTG